MPLSKGKQPRSTAKVPKYRLSGKGCDDAETTRMLAQKQPRIKRVRNSSLVEWSCAENSTGLKHIPKLRITVCGYRLTVIGKKLAENGKK